MAAIEMYESAETCSCAAVWFLPPSACLGKQPRHRAKAVRAGGLECNYHKEASAKNNIGDTKRH